jgi:hypothetical protein
METGLMAGQLLSDSEQYLCLCNMCVVFTNVAGSLENKATKK